MNFELKIISIWEYRLKNRDEELVEGSEALAQNLSRVGGREFQSRNP